MGIFEHNHYVRSHKSKPINTFAHNKYMEMHNSLV